MIKAIVIASLAAVALAEAGRSLPSLWRTRIPRTGIWTRIWSPRIWIWSWLRRILRTWTRILRTRTRILWRTQILRQEAADAEADPYLVYGGLGHYGYGLGHLGYYGHHGL